MHDSNSDRDPLEILAEEFAGRLRKGERPAISEYAARLPGREDEVRELFPALAEIEQLKPVTGDLTGAFEPPSADPADPERVGEFKILRRVGVGGMGVVYEAVQESLGRHVALKILPPEALLDPRRLERFRREAKAAARLHHTNIVPVFGTGEADGRHYYAMQFIPGHPLDAVVAEIKRLKGDPGARAVGPVSEVAAALATATFAAGVLTGDSGTVATEAGSPSLSGSISAGRGYCQTVARLGEQAAEALAYAHAQGIVHRDIKPSNLLLDLRGTVWVTDFGLAKSSDTDDLTHAGDVVGTLRYLAPERFEGQGDHRADVYALGLTLYELLTLRPAFSAENRAKLVQQVTEASPARPRSIDPGIPRDLETIVLKAIARDPAMRYQSASEMAEDLRRFVEDRPIQARRASSAEQAWRWCRRNPAVASLLATVLVVFAAGAGISTFFAVRADRNASRATEAAREAIAERTRADAERTKVVAEQDRTRRLLYASQMQSASEAANSSRFSRLVELLDESTPRPGEPDLRGWEWNYLDRFTRNGQTVTMQGEGPFPERSWWVAFSADGQFGCVRRPLETGQIYEIFALETGKRVGRIPREGVLPLPTPPPTPPRQGKTPVLDYTYHPYEALSVDGKVLLTLVDYPANTAAAVRGRSEIVPPTVHEAPKFWDVATGQRLDVPFPEVVKITRYFISSRRVILVGPGAAWVTWLDETSESTTDRNLGSSPRGVARWEKATGKVTHTLLPGEPSIMTGELNSDGTGLEVARTSRFAAFGERPTTPERDLTMTLEGWDLAKLDRPRYRKVFEMEAMGRTTSFGVSRNAVYSPQGRMAVHAVNGKLNVFRTSDGEVVATFPANLVEEASGTRGGVGNLAVSDDGKRVVHWRDGLVLVLEQGEGETTRVRRLAYRLPWNESVGSSFGLDSRFGQTTSYVLHPDGKTLLITSDSPRHPLIRLDLSRDPRDRGPSSNGGPLGMPMRAEMSRTFVSRDGTRQVTMTRMSSASKPGESPFSSRTSTNQFVIRDNQNRELGRFEAISTPLPARFILGTKRLLISRSVPMSRSVTTGWALYDIEGQPRLVAEGNGTPAPSPAEIDYFLEWIEPPAAPQEPGFGGPFASNGPGGVSRSAGFRAFSARDGRMIREYRPSNPAPWIAGRVRLAHSPEETQPADARPMVAIATWPRPDEGGTPRLEILDLLSGETSWTAEIQGARPMGRTSSQTRFMIASDSLTPRFSPGGRHVNVILNGEDDHTWLLVYAARDGALIHRIDLGVEKPTGTSRGRQQAFSRDGRWLALSSDLTMMVIDLEAGRLVHRLTGHDGMILSPAFSERGDRLFVLAKAPMRSLFHVWDVATGRELLKQTFESDQARGSPFGAFASFAGGQFVIDGDKVNVGANGRDWLLDGTPVKP